MSGSATPVTQNDIFSFKLCSFKIDVFLRVFSRTHLRIDLRARLLSIVMTCHKMPSHLPRNLHRVTTSRSAGNAIRKNTQHDTSKVLRLLRKMTSELSKVLRLPRPMQRIFSKRSKSIAPATKKRFLTRRETCWNVMKYHA